MKYKESQEMYLETILLLSNRLATVFSIDIARELGFSKPSVSRAIGLLEQGGYIERDSKGQILLTRSGLAKAQDVYERHSVITATLEKVGVSKEIAEDNACRIEHVITAELLEVLKKYVKNN